jgi:glycosyltransferase involved in cell wall biosynthesis
VPTFTVIIAAHQAAATLEEAVASALAQTTPPQQVVVCDDGSTDDPAAALARFGERVTLIRQANAGPAAARNAALKRATGDFVAILDADDVFEPRRLELFGELAAARPDLDILASDTWFEEDGALTGRFYDWRPFPIEDQRRAILQWCFVTTPAVRRSRLTTNGGFDPALRHGEDWDCWLRLILGGSVAGAVDEPLMRYRRHSAGLTGRRAESIAGRVTVLEKALAEPSLSAEELGILRASIAEQRARRLEALADEAPTGFHVARLLLRHALARSVGTRDRARSARRALVAVMRGRRPPRPRPSGR